MSDLKLTVGGTERDLGRKGPRNPSAEFGQDGSIFSANTDALAPPKHKVFVAITFLDDTTFDSSGGLIAEDSAKFANTEAAANDNADGSETASEGSGGLQIDVSNSFPAGVALKCFFISIAVPLPLCLY